MAESGTEDRLAGRALGEFILRELIGEGAFGRVYRAEQPALEREAVVKVLDLGARSSSAAVHRFLREARLASRLDHPFAAHVYAFGAEGDGLLWIAMELVRGTPLDRLLFEDGPLPPVRAIPFLRRLCEVVQTAHDQGIVHRDLKPANVMVVTRAGSVFPKLLDLGIARDLGGSADMGAPAAALPAAGSPALTQRGLGTPHYMAPEQWLDPAAAGPPADVYALGVIAYEVLSGRRPFGGTNLLELAAQHAREAPPPLPAELPLPLGEVIARAMAKQPGDRVASALALGDALVDASGVAGEAAGLPRIDDLVRDEAFLRAPQPVAEALAALDGALNPHQALGALREVVAAAAELVGLVALARWIEARAPAELPPVADELVRALRLGSLPAARWWQLARELCRPPDAAAGGAAAFPELRGLFFDGDRELRTAMDELLAIQSAEPAASARPESLREFLALAIPRVEDVLRSLAFFADHRLVVRARGRDESWMGVRRPVRAALQVAAELTDGRPVLCRRSGEPVVALWPLLQAEPPAPNAAPEMFLYAGRGRHGARLVARPHGFERDDPALAEWLDLHLAAIDGATARGAGQAAAPYRGLETFTAADADSFFGREKEIDAFANRLRTAPFFAVVGPSGVGKSSFLQAGVLPALGASWRAVVVRPGPSPLAALAAQLAAAGLPADAGALRARPAALGELVRGATGGDRPGTVLVVDQFEEVFTLCQDAAEREAYARALGAAARDAADPVRVLITLRDDFLARAAGLPVFRERLTGGLDVLATPIREDLLRILVEPARRAGYRFEDPELPEEMVREVADEPGALALLSFTAYQLWEFRDRDRRLLTRKAYRALGGVGGALAQHAESTLGDLDAGAQAVVREAFRHLVTADGTRAVLTRAELIELCGGEPARPVLERLTGARLLTAREGTAGEEQLEIVHEALLSAWPRVVGWRREDAEGARLRDQLRAAARQWSERARDRGLLWRGDSLTEYRLWRARYPGALTEVEEAFGSASLADASRGRRRRAVALASLIVALAAGLVVFARLRGVAETSRDQAESLLHESYLEQGRRALLEGDTPAALLLFDKALAGGADDPALGYMMARALEPLDAEAATLRGHQGRAWWVGFSPDGTRLLTTDDRGARVWDRLGRPGPVLPHAGQGLVYAAWSPDGRTVATGGGDGTVKLWDPATGAARATLAGHQGAIRSLSFSRDGALLVSASDDGTARLWDAASGALRARLDLPGSPAPVAWAALDGGGGRIALARDDGAAGVWDATDGRLVARLIGHRDRIWFAFFDPAGARVATAGADHTGRIWDATSGTQLQVLSHDQRVTDVAWSPDGRWLATASADRLIKIWDPATGEARALLRGHTAQVNRIRFSRDGRFLASAAADGTARIWDARRGLSVATYVHGGFLFDLDLAPDGETLATTSWLGTAKLWHLARKQVTASFAGEPLDAPPPHPAPLLTDDRSSVIRWRPDRVELVAIADGRVRRHPAGKGITDLHTARGLLAAGDADGRVRLFELAGGGTALDLPFDPGGVAAVALAPDAARFAAAGAGGALALFSAGGRELARRRLDPLAYHLSWSPDGGSLVALDAGGRGALLDGRSLAEIRDLGPTAGAAFSPDGTRLVTHAPGGPAAILWTRDGARLRELPHIAQIASMAWTPSGERLVVGLVDGGVQVWAADSGAALARIAAHDSFIPHLAISRDGALLVTVGFDETVKVWDSAGFRLLQSLRVPTGTTWAALDVAGEKLLTSDGIDVDVRSASRSRLDARGFHQLLRCRLPFRLERMTVLPIDDFAPCRAPAE